MRTSLWPTWRLALILAALLPLLRAAATDPKPLATPSPGYPAALTDSGRSGSASIDIVVKADGTVGEASIKAADHEAFGEAALAVIRQWTFEPGTKDGVPVERRVTVPFRFTAPLTQQLNARLNRKVFQPILVHVYSQNEYGKRLRTTKPPRPRYPPDGKGEEKVEVKYVVAPDGTTVNPEIVGSPRPEFILPAILAIAGTVYEPPVKDGKPVYVATSTRLTIAPPQPQPSKRRGGGGGLGDGGFGGAGFGGPPDE